MSVLQRLAFPFLLSLALSILALAAGTGLSSVSAWLIATAATLPGIAAIQVAVTGVRALGVARGGFRYLERLYGHRMALDWAGEIRLEAFDAMALRSPGISEKSHGEWLGRLLADVDSLRDFFVRGLQTPLSAMVLLLLSAAFLWPFGWATAYFVLSAMVTAGVLPVVFILLSRKTHRSLTRLRGDRVSLAMDLRDGRDELVLAGAEGHAVQKLTDLDERIEHLQVHSARLAGLREGLGTLSGGAFLIAIAASLSSQWMIGGISPVAMVTVTLATLAFHEVFQQVPDSIFHLAAHREAFQRIRQTRRAPLSLADTAGRGRPEMTNAVEMVLEGVRFRYPGASQDALGIPRLTLSAGSPITVVGPSGSGKSTFFALLRRVADPREGSIHLGGMALPSWDLAVLRRHIAVVSQHPWFTSGSIRENLRLGNPDATDPEMEGVLDTTGLGPWFEQMDRGLDEPLGTGMGRLSGGEAGRLALARALLQGAQVILMDEGDAHLDRPSALALATLVRKLAVDRLVIRITHGDHDLLPQDRLLVFSKGTIAEDGTLSELSSNPTSTFRKLTRLQPGIP